MSQPSPKPPRVFISYSRSDADWVHAFARDLERVLAAEGHPNAVFVDHEIQGGESWLARLQTELARSSAVVLVATPRALASGWVRHEIEAARGVAGIRVAPLRLLEEPPLPPLVATQQHFDFRDDARYEDELWAVAAHVLGRPAGALTASRSRCGDLARPTAPRSPWPRGLRGQAVEALSHAVEGRAGLHRAGDFFGARLGRRLDDLRSISPKLERASALLALLAAGDELEAARAALVTAAEEIVGDDGDRHLLDCAASCRGVAAEIEQALARAQQSTGPGARGGSPLGAYLGWVAERVQALADPFGRPDRAMSRQRVYVRPSVASEGEGSERAAGTKGGSEVRAGDLLDVLRRGRDAERPVHRWMLRGHPGSGKTTLLWRLARQLAEAGPDQAEWIPVFVSLPALLDPRASAPRSLREHALGGMGPGAQAEAICGALETLPAPQRVLLLLDGLDEVSDAQAAVDRIGALARGWGGRVTVVVSGRYIPARSAGEGFEPLHLMPFVREDWREFLEQWRHEHPVAARAWTVDKVVKRIAAQRELERLAEVPLLLMLMACLLDDRAELADNRATLYEHYFRHVLEGRHRREAAARPMAPADGVLDVLAHLALALTRDNQQEASPRELVDRFVDDDRLRGAWESLQARASKKERWRESPDAFLAAIEERSGIMRCVDPATDRWGFGHRSYREALSALALRHLPPAEIVTLTSALRGDPSAWAETLALAVGVVEDPDALVLALPESGHTALAYRALSTAPRLTPSTLESVLELGAEDPEARRSAILDLPRLAGDQPQACIDLLVGLVHRAREEGRPFADDLYFVHEALDALCERDDAHELTGYAEDERRRMMDRLPDPPAGLFERIEVPYAHGEVPLRADIAAGEFWMGSPESEGGGGAERPRHRVQITALAGAMVVPVTNTMFQAFDPGFEPEVWWDEEVTPEELAHHPAVNVSWYAAKSFCRWLRHKRVPGWQEARLPTEAEWEYLARAGSETAYFSGDGKKALAEVGWYGKKAQGRTHRVGEKRSNQWGLYDVHGNVWEWTADWWKRDYATSADESELSTNPEGPSSGDNRVVRGGSWGFSAGGCRAAVRSGRGPGSRLRDLGFRVVASAAPEPRA